MEHEFVRIPPFHRISVSSQGSIGLALANVPYIAFSDGKDDNKLAVGQCLPMSSATAELWNPFSFAAELQIVRGAKVELTGRAYAPLGMDTIQARSGVILQTFAGGGDAAGRRRGVGLIAKRGVYTVGITSTGGSPDAFECMIMKGANWQFMNFRPAGCFANMLEFNREDGTVNPQIVAISGSYTQAEIDTWKASVGYTAPDRKYFCNQTTTFSINEETAIFFTCSDAAVLRIQLVAREFGDMTSKLREF